MYIRHPIPLPYENEFEQNEKSFKDDNTQFIKAYAILIHSTKYLHATCATTHRIEQDRIYIVKHEKP